MDVRVMYKYCRCGSHPCNFCIYSSDCHGLHDSFGSYRFTQAFSVFYCLKCISWNWATHSRSNQHTRRLANPTINYIILILFFTRLNAYWCTETPDRNCTFWMVSAYPQSTVPTPLPPPPHPYGL